METIINIALFSLYVGEHVACLEDNEEVAEHFCNWLNKCLDSKMKLQYFNKIIEEIEENDNIGVTSKEEYWIDCLENYDEIIPFYTRAIKEKADRFMIYNNNSYIDLVAIKGNPNARAIEICVLGKDKKGNWLTNFPSELDKNICIKYLSDQDARLCDGTKIIWGYTKNK